MVKKKKKVMKKKVKKKKLIAKPKLPANEVFWLNVTKDVDHLEDFVARGNPQQRANIKAVVTNRLWQKQHGEIDKGLV